MASAAPLSRSARLRSRSTQPLLAFQDIDTRLAMEPITTHKPNHIVEPSLTQQDRDLETQTQDPFSPSGISIYNLAMEITAASRPEPRCQVKTRNARRSERFRCLRGCVLTITPQRDIPCSGRPLSCSKQRSLQGTKRGADQHCASFVRGPRKSLVSNVTSSAILV